MNMVSFHQVWKSGMTETVSVLVFFGKTKETGTPTASVPV